LKLADLIRHLRRHGCLLKRDTGKHTIWWNPAKVCSSAVPRHKEIKEFTARAICDALEIPRP
jgi:mRNA interferase HicA